MPKGRGSNLRRRTYKQLHPDRKRKRELQGTGAYQLQALYERAQHVQEAGRKKAWRDAANKVGKSRRRQVRR